MENASRSFFVFLSYAGKERTSNNGHKKLLIERTSHKRHKGHKERTSHKRHKGHKERASHKRHKGHKERASHKRHKGHKERASHKRHKKQAAGYHTKILFFRLCRIERCRNCFFINITLFVLCFLWLIFIRRQSQK